MYSTIEGGQLGGVGGDEAGGDAAPVAAANDGHPVLGVPVLHLRRTAAAVGRSGLNNADQETNYTAAGRPVQRRCNNRANQEQGRTARPSSRRSRG